MHNVRPHIRYRILNGCFRNRQHRYWTKEELLAELAKHDIDIDERTLLRDIEAMRYSKILNYNAIIPYCPTNKGYHYEDQNYSIEKINIADEELLSLLFCKHLYMQYKGSSVATCLDGVFNKVISSSRPNYSPNQDIIFVDNT